MSQKGYSKLETGETKLTTDRLGEIANVYGMDTVGFFNFLSSLDEKLVIHKIHSNSRQGSNTGVVINHNQGFSEKEQAQLEQRFRAIEEDMKFLRGLLLNGVKPPQP